MTKLQPVVLLVVVAMLVIALGGCPKQTEEAAGPPPITPPVGPPTTAADAGAGEAGATGAALTQDDVKQVMDCMEDKAVEKIMDGIVDGLGVEDEDSPEAIKMALDKAAENADLDEAVKAHGFADAADFVAKTKRVLPGLSIAMAKVMAEMMDIKEGTDEYEELMKDDEFKVFTEAYGEPSEEDIAMIVEVVKAQMEEQGGAKKVEEPPAEPE